MSGTTTLPVVPFAALPSIPGPVRPALEAAVLESNDRYLQSFLEPNSFCPYARSGRQRGQTRRFVHLAESTDVAPYLALMAEAARHPEHVVVQVIVPLVTVTPDEWIRFCHEVTDAGNRALGVGTDVYACAPLHPDLPYTELNAFSLIPLFRRTPDPTIQWVRQDALDALYEGRSGDTEFVDVHDLSAFLAKPRQSPLYDRIAETNWKMAQRLGIAEVERQLRALSRDAQARYAQVLLRETPAVETPPRVCPHRRATDETPARPALSRQGARWALTRLEDLPTDTPRRYLAGAVELVAVRTGEAVHVLHGRCPHRNAPLSDASVEAGSLVCPHHGWDFELATGRSRGIPGEAVTRFRATVEEGLVWVEDGELEAWRASNVAVFTEADDVL